MNQPQNVSLDNPFVGLRPYQSEESLYYFGRGEQNRSLLSLLHHHRFVAVVGSSGSGKSSLVRAGLIPQLEAGFLVQERDHWQVATMKPGEAPLHNLVQALADADGKSITDETEDAFLESLQELGARALLEKLEPLLLEQDASLLLLVDQFEELFRFALEEGTPERREQAEEFVALLLRLSSQRELPIFVCLTMRSDFLGDCDAFHGLPEAINRSQFLVPRLSRDQRREAITNPVYLAGGGIAPRLTDLLLNENINTRDDLPILQHLLMRCWDAWRTDPEKPPQIDLRHYQQVNTIHHTLDDHADEALEELEPEQQVIAKKLFQALTTTDEANRRIRRPAHVSEICAVSKAPANEIEAVIDVFIANGRSFLNRSKGKSVDDPLIDISHESLIRQWKNLGEWVDEEAEAAKTYRRLVETAELHSSEKPRFYREADLIQALEWREGHNRIWAARYPGDFGAADDFLKQSQETDRKEKDKQDQDRREHVRLLQEKAELAERQVEQERVAAKNSRRLLWVVGVFAVLMVFAAGAALYAWNHATNKSEEAIQEKLNANFYIAKAFEEKALSALEKAKESQSTVDYQDALLYTLESVQQQVSSERIALNPSTIGEFGLTPINKIFAEQWFSKALDTGTKVFSVAFSPDGNTLVSGSGDQTVRLWDITTMQRIITLTANPPLASKVSEALQFLWERSLKDITFVHQSRRPSLLPIEGYYLADAAKYRPLLNPPAANETKLDQVM